MFMKVVIIAGGQGARVRPYSNILPKPMIPIGKYPVLEIIIRQLVKSGLGDEIVLSTEYMAEIMESFFGDGKRFGAKITYSREKTRLGTVGGIDLLRDKLKETFLIMNGDILVDIDFKDLIKKHKESKAMITAVCKKFKFPIELGVVKSDESGKITDIVEKPVHEAVGTVGIYLMEPEVLNYVEMGKFLDAPDLLLKLIKAQQRVQMYEINGAWFHLSRKNDFESANEKWKDVIKELHLDDVVDISDE